MTSAGAQPGCTGNKSADAKRRYSSGFVLTIFRLIPDFERTLSGALSFGIGPEPGRGHPLFVANFCL